MLTESNAISFCSTSPESALESTIITENLIMSNLHGALATQRSAAQPAALAEKGE